MRAALCRFALLGVLALALPARAVLNNGVAVTTAPTGADVANWSTGWGAAGISGWDYVGTVNGASGVYLGNGWVLTAAHVGAGGFTLNGVGYSLLPGSATSITEANGTADLQLFRLETMPTLPSLVIRSSDPAVASYVNAGSTVVTIGYGGGNKSWGAATVTVVSTPVALSPYVSTDFGWKHGATTYPSGPRSRTVTNTATLAGGDSGGPGFIFNAAASRWELAGINEVLATDGNGNTYSLLVQVNRYAAKINSVTSGSVSPVPEPAATAAGGVLLAALAVLARRRARDRRAPLPARF